MHTVSQLPRFVVFVFDALRRDMILSEHMPHLRRFIDEGCDFPIAAACFPRRRGSNAASLASCRAGGDGRRGEQVYEPGTLATDCSTRPSTTMCRPPRRRMAEPSSQLPTLGELLADAGRTLARDPSARGRPVRRIF